MTWYDDGGNTPPHEPPPAPNWHVASVEHFPHPAPAWPTCTKCGREYIPIPVLQGCPWCSGAARVTIPGETWKDRYNRRRREERARHRLGVDLP